LEGAGEMELPLCHLTGTPRAEDGSGISLEKKSYRIWTIEG
jgi:hypothetical protein